MKRCILVRDDSPLGFALVSVAHASPAGDSKFRDAPEVAIALKPRHEWPKMFDFLRLHRDAPAHA